MSCRTCRVRWQLSRRIQDHSFGFRAQVYSDTGRALKQALELFYTTDFLGHSKSKCNQMSLALFEDGEEGSANSVSTAVMRGKCISGSYQRWTGERSLIILCCVWALWRVTCPPVSHENGNSFIWSESSVTNLSLLQLTKKLFVQ